MIKIKILTKIFFAMLVAASISFAGMLYQLHILEKKQPKIVEDNILKTSKLIVNEVDNWMDKNLRSSKMITKIAGVKEMDAARQVPVLVAATETLEWASILFVADVKGNAIARSDGKKLRNYSDREYVKQILAGDKVGQQVLIGKAKPIPLQCFAVPIKNPGIVGILTQCSSLTDISDFVVNQRIGLTGIAFLVDDKKRLIAHGDVQGLTAKLQDFSSHPALKTTTENKIRVVEVDGKDRVFVVSDVGLNWKLVVQQDYDEAYANYLDLKQSSQYIMIVSVILVLLISILIIANLAAPIKKLTESANNFSKGRFGDPIDFTKRNDEIGELAKSIERMGVSIRLALKRLKSSSN
jgi:methyl-accepting chemotaxis protein